MKPFILYLLITLILLLIKLNLCQAQSLEARFFTPHSHVLADGWKPTPNPILAFRLWMGPGYSYRWIMGPVNNGAIVSIHDEKDFLLIAQAMDADESESLENDHIEEEFPLCGTNFYMQNEVLFFSNPRYIQVAMRGSISGKPVSANKIITWDLTGKMYQFTILAPANTPKHTLEPLLQGLTETIVQEIGKELLATD